MLVFRGGGGGWSGRRDRGDFVPVVHTFLTFLTKTKLKNHTHIIIPSWYVKATPTKLSHAFPCVACGPRALRFTAYYAWKSIFPFPEEETNTQKSY